MIIREHSGFRLSWDALILALVLLSCVLIPYQLAFVQDAARVNNGLMLVISLFFMVDIGLNFFTCRSSISICVKVHEHESEDRERKLVHAASRQA